MHETAGIDPVCVFCVEMQIVALCFRSPIAAAACLAASAEVGEEHDDEMGDEPDVVIAHVLIDVDQNEYARGEDAEQDVRPYGDYVLRKQAGEHQQIDKHHYPRKEKRE